MDSGLIIRMIAINTVFWLVCCLGTAHAVRFLPKAWYARSDGFFAQRPFEKKLYKKIRIERWKDKLPEGGGLWNFQKKNLHEKLTPEYADRFILETKYGEVGHWCMAVLGFACVLVNPSEYAGMALVCALVNVIVQIPFCLIQRYNRPRLIRLRSRLADKNEQKA